MLLLELINNVYYKSIDRVDIECLSCHKLVNVKVSTARFYYKRRGPNYTCHRCMVIKNMKSIADKLHKRSLEKGYNCNTRMEVKCDNCNKLFIVKHRSIVANRRRNSGKYYCKPCGLISAHKNGKFDVVYNDQHKIKLKESSDKFWIENRGSWRDILVTKEFREKMSECGKRAWTKSRKKIEATRSTKEFKDKLSKWGKMAWDAEFRIRFSNIMRELWKDPEFSNYIKISSKISSTTLWNNDEYRIKTLKAISNNWDNSIFYERFINRIKELWKDSIFYDKVVGANKKRWEDPEFRLKMCELAKKRWEDPEYREKMTIALGKHPKISTQQYVLYSILDDLKINYDMEYRMGYYHVDCRIPIQDGIKKSLIIEVQGNYWHSLHKRIIHDKSRATYLKEYFPEYDLKYLWEHEFNNKDRIVSLLRYWLGISEPEVVDFGFDKVVSRIVDFRDAELFISKYHYAGRVGRSGLNIGFFVNDVLVAVCVFAYPVRQETAKKQGLKYNQVFELTRLAIHPSYQKKNFASFIIGKSIKLVKVDRPEVRRLVSFSDSTFNHCGIIYKASNWVLDGVVKSDYWYRDGDGYVCHKKTLWNKAKQMVMTEGEYCDKYGYVKVFGGEKRRFVYNL